MGTSSHWRPHFSSPSGRPPRPDPPVARPQSTASRPRACAALPPGRPLTLQGGPEGFRRSASAASHPGPVTPLLLVQPAHAPIAHPGIPGAQAQPYVHVGIRKPRQAEDSAAGKAGRKTPAGPLVNAENPASRRARCNRIPAPHPRRRRRALAACERSRSQAQEVSANQCPSTDVYQRRLGTLHTPEGSIITRPQEIVRVPSRARQ
jgi:hypothetical protein